ncbi:MAG: antitoxin family protein [Methanomicrobia archaeon]|nr:antitoxin family protein [Methanomicrobia archaeon]
MEEIEVIYENGVFKPVKKVNLKEGSRGKIKVVDKKNILLKYFQTIPLKLDQKRIEALRTERMVR